MKKLSGPLRGAITRNSAVGGVVLFVLAFLIVLWFLFNAGNADGALGLLGVVVGFALSYVTGQLQEKKKHAEQMQNVRLLLSEEVASNLTFLMSIQEDVTSSINAENGSQSTLPISSRVWTAYLGEIAGLFPEETVRRLLIHYALLDELREHHRMYLYFIAERSRTSYQEQKWIGGQPFSGLPEYHNFATRSSALAHRKMVAVWRKIIDNGDPFGRDLESLVAYSQVPSTADHPGGNNEQG